MPGITPRRTSERFPVDVWHRDAAEDLATALSKPVDHSGISLSTVTHGSEKGRSGAVHYNNGSSSVSLDFRPTKLGKGFCRSGRVFVAFSQDGRLPKGFHGNPKTRPNGVDYRTNHAAVYIQPSLGSSEQHTLVARFLPSGIKMEPSHPVLDSDQVRLIAAVADAVQRTFERTRVYG